MEGSCYYSVLGLSKHASSANIRSAYRKLALEWHPDKWTNKPPLEAVEANRKFQKIQEAYSVLSDENKKSMYDAGALDLFDDIDDKEGMGDFLHDLMKMMDNNPKAETESLEDLQKTFVDMFGDDLREFMEKQDRTDRKRARVSLEKTNMSRSRACR
uniref:chaperone protein DnaJ-like n=1 Tax=Erigeron canadensis TaxID=72917 RepID=UPI001CB8EE00|nr:chaperone protein DnaJ-like [Erigeron canadensis]